MLKETVKALPEHTDKVCAGTSGDGFTVITKSIGVPTHPLLDGVTV